MRRESREVDFLERYIIEKIGTSVLVHPVINAEAKKRIYTLGTSTFFFLVRILFNEDVCSVLTLPTLPTLPCLLPYLALPCLTLS